VDSVSGASSPPRCWIARPVRCRILGYPIPKAFKRTQPRFPGQFFDTYAQKSNNLQVWNEELSSIRRYVLVRVSEADVVTRVKVVTGNALATLDTTGTLTQKYQARCNPGVAPHELTSPSDTEVLKPFLSVRADLGTVATPIEPPVAGQLLPIRSVFERLRSLVGEAFPDTGYDQERNRGASPHRLSCAALGYASYQDDGQFPLPANFFDT
jgi:hypothetical protein